MADIEERPGAAAAPARQRERLLPLEAMRGIAAIVVVAHHFGLAFVPAASGRYAQMEGLTWLVDSPLFVLINGPAAVSVFFVLSGFVLTRGAFDRREPWDLFRAGAKRWPRLAGPTLLAALISYVIYAAGLYRFEEAGKLARSPDLYTSFFALKSASSYYSADRSLVGALGEGLFTFFTGAATYNVVFWTLKFELLGSAFAFVLCGLLRRRVALGLPFAVLLLGVPFVGAMVAGTLLASIPRQRQSPPSWLLGFASIAGILLLSASAQSSFRLWSDWAVLLNTVGALLLVSAMVWSDSAAGLFSGRASWVLGQLSFPIYLAHVPVLTSIASYSYIALVERGNHDIVVLAGTAAALTVGCVPPTYLLWRFDRWWVRAVNSGVARLLPRRAEPLPASAEDRAQRAVA